jgi:ribonuclease HII
VSGSRTAPSTTPGLAAEQGLWDAGAAVVVGVDEVGKGSWAGPLSVGAAVIPTGGRMPGIRDSKQLSEPRREGLFDAIAGWCTAWSVGHASAEECDLLGMSAAQRLAARRAIEGLNVVADRYLVDGRWDFVGSQKTTTIVRGDASSLSIASASILAKVTRDRMMRTESSHYPAYGFERNKGYPAPVHRAALAAFGPTPIHRTTWAFMDDLPWSGIRRRSSAAQTAFPIAKDA